MSSSLHNDSVVIDALSGGFVPMPTPRDGIDYPTRLRNAGLTAVSVTLVSKFATFDDALFAIYDYELVWQQYRDILRQVLVPEDILGSKQEGKVGVLLGFQTATPVGDDLRRVTLLAKLGIRMMSITYMEANLLGSGCLEPTDHGLTHLGRQVVREMNRLGMIVDLSHVGDRTSLDAIEISEAPPIFSHSGARAVTNHPRNIPDEAIRAVAAKGGLVCLTPYGPCISPDPDRGVQATMEDFVRHVRHAVDLVGIDAVGIGTDLFEAKGAAGWDATTKRRYPESVGAFSRDAVNTVGVEDMGTWPSLTEALTSAGFAAEEVAKIVGGNFLRVFGRVASFARG
jgi:membrane dipeptidase